MTHVRQQVREQVAARLTGLPMTGNRVFQSRMRPQREADLPCLLVVTDDEEIAQSVNASLFERRLDVTVIGIVKQAGAVDDALDQIALEVETAMAAEYRASLRGIETAFDDETDKPVGRVALRYQFVYLTRAGNPGAFA